MIFKVFQALKQAVLPILICGIGLLLLAAPYNPGAMSNVVAWLETDGGGISLCMGTILLIGGIIAIFCSFRSVYGRLYMSHGKLTCLVEQNVIQGLVEQILSEYFETKDLQAEVSLSKSGLHLIVQVPEGKKDITGLTNYLRDRLYHLAGYYGKIYLFTKPKTESSASQEPA